MQKSSYFQTPFEIENKIPNKIKRKMKIRGFYIFWGNQRQGSHSNNPQVKRVCKIQQEIFQNFSDCPKKSRRLFNENQKQVENKTKMKIRHQI